MTLKKKKDYYTTFFWTTYISHRAWSCVSSLLYQIQETKTSAVHSYMLSWYPQRVTSQQATLVSVFLGIGLRILMKTHFSWCSSTKIQKQLCSGLAVLICAVFFVLFCFCFVLFMFFVFCFFFFPSHPSTWHFSGWPTEMKTDGQSLL